MLVLILEIFLFRMKLRVVEILESDEVSIGSWSWVAINERSRTTRVAVK